MFLCVYLQNLWSQASIYLLTWSLNLTFHLKFWARLLPNLSSCILILSLSLSRLPSPLYNCLLLLPASLPPRPPSFLSPPFSRLWISLMPASWVIGPESIPLRPLRKTSRGRRRVRKRRNKRQRKRRGWRKKWEATVEGLGGRGGDSGKEVFLSRSTAAQSHMQHFPLAETHFARTHMRV